jgi:hypothetical protein
METRSIDQMLKIVEEDPNRLLALQQSPLEELQRLAAEAKARAPIWTRDKWLYRVAVVVLGALALIAAAGSLALVFGDKNTPEVLIALGSAAVGALVGLFAPPPTGP